MRYFENSMHPRWREHVVRTVYMVFAFLVPACGGRYTRSEPPGPKVSRVRIEGDDKVSRETIIRHIDLQPSSTFGDKYYYLPGMEVVDQDRILRLYESYGYYDTSVDPIQITLRRKNWKVRRQRADVSIRLQEGEGTTITGVNWTWHENAGQSAGIDRQAVEDQVGLKTKTSFSIVALNEAAQKIELAAKEQGFAFVEVDEQADVDRIAHTAQVAFEVHPGARYRISNIEIRGLQRVSLDLVQREVSQAVGRQFAPSLLAQIEATVYAMQVFSTVHVEVGKATSPGALALIVHVQEQRMQQISAGLLFDIDPVRWSERAGLRYRHLNLLHDLIRFEANLLAGWAELPNPIQPVAHGPRLEFSTSLSKRGWLERKLLWTLEPKTEVDIRQGYQFWSFQNRLGVSRMFGNFSSLSLSYNNRYVNFFNLTPGFRSVLNLLEILVHDPYLSSYLEAQAELFSLDSLIGPTQGVRVIVNYQFANRFLGSDFDYHRVQPEVRLYWHPHRRIEFATRARVGFIFPYGGSPGAPFDQKYYLGGQTTCAAGHFAGSPRCWNSAHPMTLANVPRFLWVATRKS